MAQKVKNLSAMPGVWNIPWMRKWKPLPAFMPGELHGQRRTLAGYNPCDHKESDTTEGPTLSLFAIGVLLG